MNIEDYDYHLPPHLIAQHPPSDRTDARLLCLAGESVSHKKIPDIKTLLHKGDVLVLNNTRVIKARLQGRKATGGAVEALAERVLDEHTALCQVRVSKPIKVGGELEFGGSRAVCRGRVGEFYQLEFSEPALTVFEQYGKVPLPPYIEHTPDDQDMERYQTVFGEVPGAVAAPTAGLHFSTLLLTELVRLGIEIVYVTLHVGAGTFQPIRGQVADHVMHAERYVVTEDAATAVRRAKNEGRRVVAVGTTAVRTLEAVAALHQGEVVASEGETRLFITPGFEFKVVDALLTNFHLPRSTLMMLVSAFAGHERIIQAYATAVAQEYRFFSYGDACWLERHV